MKSEERDRDGLRPEDERPSAPAPDTGAGGEAAAGSERVERPDPTRYGDWEKNGRCIDF